MSVACSTSSSRGSARGGVLVLTASHRGDSEFYELGRITHEVAPETLFDALPEQPPHLCETAETCWVVDFWSETSMTGRDREVTAEVASDLLGEDAHVALARARADSIAYYQENP